MSKSKDIKERGVKVENFWIGLGLVITIAIIAGVETRLSHIDKFLKFALELGGVGAYALIAWARSRKDS